MQNSISTVFTILPARVLQRLLMIIINYYCNVTCGHFTQRNQISVLCVTSNSSFSNSMLFFIHFEWRVKVFRTSNMLFYLLVVMNSLLVIPSNLSLPGKMSDLRGSQLDGIQRVIINVL